MINLFVITFMLMDFTNYHFLSIQSWLRGIPDWREKHWSSTWTLMGIQPIFSVQLSNGIITYCQYSNKHQICCTYDSHVLFYFYVLMQWNIVVIAGVRLSQQQSLLVGIICAQTGFFVLLTEKKKKKRHGFYFSFHFLGWGERAHNDGQ